MEDPADVIEALRVLDLTRYEAQAYLGLTRGGRLTARDVSRDAEIPHSKVYEVLFRLEGKGLVQVQPGRPRLFKAVSAELGLQRLEQRLSDQLGRQFSKERRVLEETYKREMTDVSQSRNRAFEMLSSHLHDPSRTRPSEDIIWTIHEKESVISETRGLLDKARRDVLLILPDDDLSLFAREIDAATARNVRIEMITNRLTRIVTDLAAKCAIYRAQQTPPTKFGIILVDGKNAMFIQKDYESAFRTSSRSLLTVLRQFFEHERQESARV